MSATTTFNPENGESVLLLNEGEQQVQQLYEKLVNVNFLHLTSQLQQLSEVNHHLTGQVRHLTDVNHQLSGQLSLVTQDNNQLSSQLNHLTQVNHQFTTQLNQLTQVNQELTSQLNQLSRVNHQLTCQLDQLTQLDQSTSQFDLLTRVNHQLATQLDQLLVTSQAQPPSPSNPLDFGDPGASPFNPLSPINSVIVNSSGQLPPMTGCMGGQNPSFWSTAPVIMPLEEDGCQKLRERVDLSFYKPEDTRIILRPFNYVKVLGRETVPTGKKRKEFYNEFVLPEGIPVLVSWYPSGHVYIEASVRKEPQIGTGSKKWKSKRKKT